MNNIVLIISSCVAQLTFVSPDELIKFKTNYREAPFGNPGAFLTYGKLFPFNISSDCTIPNSVSQNITSETILVVYSASSICEPIKIANDADYKGANGVLFVWDHFDYPGNSASFIQVYPYRGSYVYTPNILCLFIDSKAGEAIQRYSTKTIWITYRMQMWATSEKVLNFYLDSNYENDYKYLKFLQYLYDKNFTSIYEFNFYLLYTNTSSDLANDCYKSNSNKYYCLNSTYLSKGVDRVMNTMLMLNFFYLKKDILIFKNYTKDLYGNCSNSYSIDCNKKVIESYNAVPSLDEQILTYSYLLYHQFIPSVSSHNVFIYNPNYFTIIFLISSHSNYYCQKKQCTSVMIEDDRCEFDCNTTECSYDNLNCLKNHGCYTFILEDGNCNKDCEIDRDCDKDADMFFLKIVLPAIAGSVM